MLGAHVTAWDPAVHTLPPELGSSIALQVSPEDALRGASALVVATEWPQLRELDLTAMLPLMARPLVLDPNRFLAARLAGLTTEYYAVGVP